jgi:protein-disulfide isomerase
MAVSGLPAPAAGQVDLEEGLAEATELGWAVGSDSAAITVVEFTDFSCPYCAGFHEGTRAELRREFVESGQVRWITLSYVSGLYPRSDVASRAAECAGRVGEYERFMGAAFRHRDRWVRATDEGVREVVRELADGIGLDRSDFEACMADPQVGERIAAAARLARELGVRGTPTWFVDGFPVMGNLPLGYARRFILNRLQPLPVRLEDHPDHPDVDGRESP